MLRRDIRQLLMHIDSHRIDLQIEPKINVIALKQPELSTFLIAHLSQVIDSINFVGNFQRF